MRKFVTAKYESDDRNISDLAYIYLEGLLSL